MDLWQQQHKVFSTSLLETINFSRPASHLYVVTLRALHKMQKLCYLFHPGQGLTARADSQLWYGAAVAPQITALCKGHMRRSSEKLCWGSPSLCLGAAGKLRPWAMSQLCLCLAMYLAVPDLVTWLPGLTLGLPHCNRLLWQSLGCQLNLITTFVRALHFWLVWDCTSCKWGDYTCLPCCHPQLLAHLLLRSSPTFAAPQQWEHILFYLQSQDWGLH